MMVTMLAASAASARADTQSLVVTPPAARHQRQNWFPPATHTIAYQLTPQIRTPDELSNQEQAIAPLPPAATTGLAGLVSLGLVGARKSLKRFLFG
jgi:hypothetical protein